jgi:hypothetical protein
MNPWEDLADHWRTLGELQVHETMTEQLSAPCIVLMPDDPWIEPGGFSTDTERYLAYAVAGSATADAAQRQLHLLIHFIRHHLPEGWDFVSAGAPAQRDHQGATYMAAESRLTFNQCTGGDPYEGVASS